MGCAEWARTDRIGKERRIDEQQQVTGSGVQEEGTDAAGSGGLDDERPAAMAPRQAQEALLVLGYLGRLLTEAMNARVELELAGNAEAIVVTYLDVHGPSRPVDIVTFTGMTSGGVTKLLDRLEGGGFITREFGTFPGDRRATVLALTPEGTRLAGVYADALLAVSEDVRAATARLCTAAG